MTGQTDTLDVSDGTPDNVRDTETPDTQTRRQLKADRKAVSQTKKDTKREQRHRDKQARKDKRHQTLQTLKARQRHARAWLSTQKPSHVATVSLAAGLAIVATINFMVSYVGLFGFGQTEMELPWLLPVLAPFGVDGFTLCGIAATYLLRHGHLRVRVFAWAIFGIPTLLSVAANISHAKQAHLSGGGTFGYAVSPLLLAGATHACIVVIRHLEKSDYELGHGQPDTETSETPGVGHEDKRSPSPVSRTSQTTSANVPTRHVPDASQSSMSQTGTVTNIQRARHNDRHRDFARHRAAEGAPVSDIEKELSEKGVSVTSRTIARWTQDIRTSA